MGLQLSDHCCPVAKISDAGKEKIACTCKKIAGHSKHKKIACGRPVSLRLEEKEPKDQSEKKVDESAVRGHPSRLDIALQRHRAQSYLSRPTQPRGHPMAQPFVQDVLKHAGQYRHGNHGKPIVLPGPFTVEHSVSYITPVSGCLRQISSKYSHRRKLIQARESSSNCRNQIFGYYVPFSFRWQQQPCFTECEKCGINV